MPLGPTARPFAVAGEHKWPGRWPFGWIAFRYPARWAGLGKWLVLWPDDATKRGNQFAGACTCNVTVADVITV